MDKSWMNLPDRFDTQFIEGVEAFIMVATNHADSAGRTLCPCKICNNRYYKQISEVRDHLLEYGMDKHYTRWLHHGEGYEEHLADDDGDYDDASSDEGVHFDGLEDLLQDLRGPTPMDNFIPDMQYRGGDHYTTTTHHADTSFGLNGDNGDGGNGGEPNLFDKLLSEARQPLYPGCQKFSKLDYLMKLFHLKVINRWSNKSFDMILELIKATLPVGETLPKSYHEAKTLMRELGLGYIAIHACKYDCALFWDKYKDLQSCPVCGESRYKILEGKSKKIPHKVLRYFPLKPRLQRLFKSRMTAVDMRWHKEKRVPEENVFKHPADSKTWKDFDNEYEWFSDDPRNVRLGLASDGFNPFGDMSTSYSMWPVMLVPYNLPPWKCMKDPFLFMSLLIPGPKSPGNDIDVYLQPLVDELRDLWDNGVETYDVVSKQIFQLHAALLWTINDFPAFGNLSGWSTKGKLACPNYNKDTVSMYLKNGHKLCYMASRRFLPPRHSWRSRGKNLFDGKVENRPKPKDLDGVDVLSQVDLVEERKLGKNPINKKRKRTEIELNWTKKSVFFDLPYWPSLELRHNLDVMHIEKNICENVLGTLLNIDGKTKDSFKARLDLAELGIRKELHLIPNGNKYIMPAASYIMSSTDKKAFCEWLKSVKFPDAYASNISRCVNVNESKISGMKSHDCHVLLQRLLPAALRGFLCSDVAIALIELGIFFQELCCKTLRVEVLENMKKDIAVILCKLEQIFPPAFFDIMVHLAVHLPHEALLGGPVQYRWMYPIERFLHTLKQYIRNKARPEGSIAEAYIDNECLNLCSMYLHDIETRFNREERNFDGGQEKQPTGLLVFSQNVRPLGAFKVISLSLKDYDKARYYVLNNSEEVLPYFDEHRAELIRQSSHHLEERQEKYFPEWFEQRMHELRSQNSPEATDELYSLACGPDPRAIRYSGCIMNGIRFHTKDREVNLRTQNSGIVVQGCHQSKEIDFYGVLTDVIVLNYLSSKKVYLFQCDWWDVGNGRSGIQTNGHVTSVNISRTWYKDDRFVLATQAGQVFYVSDTKLRGSWHVVQKIKPRNIYDIVEREVETIAEYGVAFQEEEQNTVDDIVQHDQTLEEINNDNIQMEELASVLLNRDDLILTEVNDDVILANINRTKMDDQFIIDDESDEEDDTLINYCSSEEEKVISSDNDTDID